MRNVAQYLNLLLNQTLNLSLLFRNQLVGGEI